MPAPAHRPPGRQQSAGCETRSPKRHLSAFQESIGCSTVKASAPQPATPLSPQSRCQRRQTMGQANQNSSAASSQDGLGARHKHVKSQPLEIKLGCCQEQHRHRRSPFGHIMPEHQRLPMAGQWVGHFKPLLMSRRCQVL